MVKLVYCITKKAGFTDEEFFHYWENIHGPIGARIPRLRRLVQSHRLTVPRDKHRPDLSGNRLAQSIGARAEQHPQRAQQGCDISLLNARIRIS